MNNMNNINNGNMPLMPIPTSMGNAQMMQPMMGNNGNMMGNMNGANMMGGNITMGTMSNMNGNNNQQGGSVVDSLFAGNLNGPATGTSIREIQQPEHNDSPRSPKRNHNNERYVDSDKEEIRKLARNINKSLDNYEPSKAHTDEENEDKLTDEDCSENKKKDDDNYSILQIGKEMILIVMIYVVLSQGFVRKSIASHITQLNPNSEGVISLTGYVIYGSILAVLFVFFRYFVIK